MAENLDPINIDINMRQNVSEESERASRGMDNMTNASKALKEQIETQKKVISDLEKQYTQAKQSLENLSNKFSSNHTFSDKEITELTKKYNAAKKLIDEAKSALDGEKNALSRLETELNKANQAQNKASNSSISYMTQMRKIRQEMQELAMAGKQESSRYRELEAELARVGTAYNRVRAEQRLLTTAGNAHIAGLMQGMSGLAGVFSAGQGVASLFVKNNEQLAAIQTKLQAAMAITIGLQQVSNTLHATSAFRINTVNKITQIWTATNYALGKSFIKMGASANIARVASAGLLSLGIGALVVGIGLLINKYKDWSKEQERKTKLIKEEQEVLRETNKNINENLIRVRALEKVLKDSNDTYAKRNIALNELKSIMPTYNAMLSKEGKLIEDNTGALKKYVKELKNSALAKIYVDKYAKAQEDYENWLDNLSPVDKAIRDLSDEDLKKVRFDANSDWERLRKEEIDHLKAIQKWEDKAQDYIEKDIAKVEVNTKEYWEIQQKSALARLQVMKTEEKGSKKWNDTLAEYNQASTKLKTWDFSGNVEKKAETAAEKARKKAQALKKAQEKQSLQEVRAAEDLEIQISEAEIKAMDEGSKKVLAQMELNYKKEKMALQRQMEDALKAKKDNARTLFEASPENKGKTFDDSGIKLTEEELKKYQDLQTKNTQNFEKDKFNLELQYMRDYIKEYGTFQQKKLSIAQEYDKKIAASNNEWEKKSLNAQKQTAISNVDFEAVNKKIDWQIVFGNMTGMLQSQLKETLSGLKDYVKTDQFKASSDTDKKTVYEAIEKLSNAMPGGQGTLNFNVINQQMNELANAINDLQTATVNEQSAYNNLSKAQEKYEKALESGNQALIESAKTGLDMANTAANQASVAYKDAETNVENLGNTFKQTSGDTIEGLNLVADGLNGFASNSLPQVFKGLQNTLSGLSKLNIGGKVGEAIGGLSKALSSASVIGQIISAVLSILDILKDGIGTLISNLIDTILNAVNGILKNLLSGEMFVQIFNSLKDGIGNILNTISFGGFNSLVNSINGSNAKETAETISRLTTSNEALKVSVDALKDEMAGSNGAKSIQAYNEAVDAQKRYNENLRNILNAQMGYHSSHHSNSYYWDLNSNSLKEVNKLLGTSLNNSWGDFSKLTADQMNQIRTHLPDIWSEMINQGKYGDRFKNDWNNYADQAGKIEDLTDSLRENIAQISFSSLRDSFVNALMDMDADAQDFASNFEEYMTKALLNFAIGDLLDDDLKKWYESWTDSMNDQQGKLTESQIEDYRNQWDAMVQDALDKRDEIASLTGYTGKNNSGRTGSSKGVATASQDSINELNGGIYALRQQVGDIRNLEKESVLIQRTQQASLNRIVENTEFCRYLLDVKNSLEDMQTRGIKVKV